MWLDILKGAGSILNAGVSLYNGRQANKLMKQQMDYQRQRDALADKKQSLTQSNLDSAIASVYGEDEKKKKKKNLLNSDVDLSLSYGV